MNKIIYILASAILAMGAVSCEKADSGVDYPAPVPTSKIGKALVNNTKQIASLYKDSSYVLAKGVEVTELAYMSYDGVAQKMFFMEIDLNEKLTLDQVFSGGGDKFGKPKEPLSQVLYHYDSPDFHIYGAVNTDFGSNFWQGPQGICIHNGVILKDEWPKSPIRPRCIFWMTKDKVAYCGEAADYEYAKAHYDIEEAFAGSPLFVENGRLKVIPQIDLSGRNPRTCVGVSEDGKKVWFMEVDGRRWTWSNGLDFPDMSEIMVAVGCYSAINVDGGGTSTFVVRSKDDYTSNDRFEVRNWPYDFGGQERALWNGVAVVAEK